MSTVETDQLKEVEYYAAGVAAWYSTSLEYDKSLLTLSAGGIALHITLLTTVGIKSTSLLAFYVLSILAFLVCLSTLLVIFRKNRSHLELALSGKDDGLDKLLAKLDLIAVAFFAVGVASSAAVGIAAGIESYADKEQAMATKRPPGFNSDWKSFGGSGTLKPRPTESSPLPSSNPPAPTPSPTAPVATPDSGKKKAP